MTEPCTEVVVGTRLVASFVGGDPEPLPTCPWRCVEDPLVADVMRLRREREVGIPMDRGMSPRLREAMAEFHAAYESAAAERRRLESDEAEVARELARKRSLEVAGG